MTAPTPDENPSAPRPPATDREDERLSQYRGVSGAVKEFTTRVRGGDFGSLPVVIGLAVIWTVFQIYNPIFLTSGNLNTLATQCAAIGIIALGIVLILLLGEIDLSVGSVSGLSAAIMAVQFVQHGWPLWLSIVVPLVVGLGIGLVYGFLYTRFGVPSFVITLAGLLGILGVQLWVLGKTGSINMPVDSWIVDFARHWHLPPSLSYVLVALVVIAFAVQRTLHARKRAAAGLSALSTPAIAVRSLGVLVLVGVPTWYLNKSNGISAIFLLFLAFVVLMNFVLTRTTWGRSIFAIGGNVEAARRAGIRVKSVYVSVFMLTSGFAALGGILATARLGAANQSSGGGDTNLTAIAAAVIGGTSLFGGRGGAFSALLGILVIQSISNGLTLLSLDTDVRYMVTGIVLLLAVIADSLSRRTRVRHGRA